MPIKMLYTYFVGEIAFVSDLRKRDPQIDEMNDALLRFF